MNKLKVGQVVFLLDIEAQKIIPAQIVAENIQRTLKEKIVTYDAMTESSKIKIDDSNCDVVFESSKKVFDYLLAQATASITFMVDNARKLSEKLFTQQVLDIEDQKEQKTIPIANEQSKYVKVRLPDGSIVETELSTEGLI